MAIFYLPIQVHNRRTFICRLDDDEGTNHNNDQNNKNRDELDFEFVIDDSNREVIQIFKNSTIFFVGDGAEDIAISNCEIKCSYEDENTLNIEISEQKKDKKSNNSDTEKLDGFKFQEDEENGFFLKINDNVPKLDFLLRISYNAEDGKNYSSKLQFYFCQQTKLCQMAYDFGSESSQLKYKIASYPERSLNIFDCIKPTSNSENNNTFVQFPKGDTTLNESLYISKFLANNDASNVLFTYTQQAKFISNGSYLLPNLKISQIEPNAVRKITYKGSEIDYPPTRRLLYKHIQAQLIKPIVENLLTKIPASPIYFRFSLLVPNVYEQNEVFFAINAIREIFAELKVENSKIGGFEIQTISESDAAFNGLPQAYKLPGQNYFIIDSGKGTTDFSIVKVNETNAFKFESIFRGGFAGAGQVITYAILETIFFSLLHKGGRSYAQTHQKVLETFKEFLELGQDVIAGLLEYVEQIKRNTNFIKNKTQFDNEIKSLGSLSSSEKITLNEYTAVLKKFSENNLSLEDYYGFTNFYMDSMCDEIIKQLDEIPKEVKNKVDKIFLMGRAFNYEPLRKKIESKLINENVFRNASIKADISPNARKTMCLDGVYNGGLPNFSDIVGFPIFYYYQGKGLLGNLVDKISGRKPTQKKHITYDAESYKGSNLFFNGYDVSVEHNNLQMLLNGKSSNISFNKKSGVKYNFIFIRGSANDAEDYWVIRQKDNTSKKVHSYKISTAVTGETKLSKDAEILLFRSLFPQVSSNEKLRISDEDLRKIEDSRSSN